jgi:hypothetical protein
MPANPKAKYEISADDATAAAWRSALTRADNGMKKIANLMKGSLGGLGVAAITTAFTVGISKAIEYGDEIGKLAEKTGIGTAAISELAHAAKMNDIELSALTTALKKMQVEISKGADVYRRLGLSITDLKAIEPDKQFELIADRIAGIKDPADRARAAVDAFGKAGADLLPMFANGAAGIREAREEAVRLGHSMSEEAVKALQEGDDAIKQLSASWDAFMRKVAVGTVTFAKAIDLIDKDRVGELQDQIASIKAELQEASGLGVDQIVNVKKIDAATEALERLNVQLAYAISPGKTRMAKVAPTEYGSGKQDPIARDFINPQLMLELDNNFKWLEEQAKETAEANKKFFSAIDEGIEDGISETARRAGDSIDELGDRMGDALLKTEEMSVFAEEAARNMQSAFADFLFDPFDDGLKGMLKGFTDVIRRMLAEAAAAKVFESLFGTDGKGGNGAGNWLGTLLGAFGGGKAKGGPPQSGKWYVAGEHGPEPIWGGGSGAFAAGYGGGGNITVSMPVDMRGASVDAVKLFQAQQPMLIRRAADLAKAELRNERRRGTF